MCGQIQTDAIEEAAIIRFRELCNRLDQLKPTRKPVLPIAHGSSGYATRSYPQTKTQMPKVPTL